MLRMRLDMPRHKSIMSKKQRGRRERLGGDHARRAAMSVNSDKSITVGFIGVGAIGKPIADRIIAGGFKVVVTDIREEARALFEGRAVVARSAAEVAAQSDIVFGCLPSLEAYLSIASGPDSIQNSNRARIYVHIGTTGPETVRQVQELLDAKGVVTLDAPMSGGIARAAEGSLVTMISGPRAAVEQAEAVLKCYSTAVVYLGERPGAAQAMKLINNMVSAANLAVACEAMLLGAKEGLDPEKMLEVLNAGTGQNSATLSKIPKHILPRTFDYGGAMYITIKDLKAYTDEAKLQSIPTPIGEKVREAYVDSFAHGSKDDDMTVVIRRMEELAGVTLPKTR
jgi:3-hydroxyisobutyrate dehydrogenase-like beta-hydroxyacid dehydrogenase